MDRSAIPNKEPTFLGLDLGTSGLRAVIVSSGGLVQASVSSAEFSCMNPEPTWSEQDPALWISGLREVMDKLAGDHGALLRRVVGIGVSGHMHGLVALDENLVPVCPCILWNDTRSAAEAAELDGDDDVRAASGNRVFPGMTAPKVLWLRRHRPDIFARVRHVMLPKDFVNLYLTGRLATERSDLSGTCYLDVRTRGVNAGLLHRTAGGDSVALPEMLGYGTSVVGPVLPTVAAELHLRTDMEVRVAGGAADNAAAACGLGVVHPGDAFVSLGTSGVLFACAGRECEPRPESGVHTFAHAVPDTWYGMGVTLCAADSLLWLTGITGCASPSELVATLPKQADGPGPVLFLPYLSGERTPHNEPLPKGTFLGLARAHGKPALARAVVEGVAFSMRDCLSVVTAGWDSDRAINEVYITGGGALSDYWADTIAQALHVTVKVPARGEIGAALGAARLAMVAAGCTDIESVMKKVDIEKTFTPRKELAGLYDKKYERFKKGYDAVKDLTG